MFKLISILPAAMLAMSLLIFGSCEDKVASDEQCSLTANVRPAWYDANPEADEPDFSVKSEEVRLNFFGWNLDEDYEFHLQFPEKTDNYRRAILEYRMGGWNQGPADWDMTTQIVVFDKKTQKYFEIARCFTPYGGYFDASWEKFYYLDVTEYLPMLTGDCEFRVFYCGWDATDKKAHTATLTFNLYEGTPQKNTVWAETIYESRTAGSYRSWLYGYEDKDIEAPERLGLREVQVPAEVKSIMMRVGITGHGMAQGEFPDRKGYRVRNAAEFDANWYKIFINGEHKGTGYIFYENGDNYRQAGTYKYDRANWGPGLPMNTQWWTIDNLPADGKLAIDFDLDRFVVDTANIATDAQYYVWVDLFGYDR